MTKEEFAERWQQQHYPTMDLRAEVPFYYDIYQRICSVAKDGCKKINEFYVIQILLYVENMGHLKLDGVYAQLYRRSEDMVGLWCGLMELSAPTVNAVKMIVGEAFVMTLKQLKSYNWEIFKGKGAFDLDKAIKDVENLLKK